MTDFRASKLQRELIAATDRIRALTEALGEVVEHHDDYCSDPSREAPGEHPCPEATDAARALLNAPREGER